MNLLVDVGNTRLKWQLVSATGELQDSGAFNHQRSDPDQWGSTLWSELRAPADVVIANVTGERTTLALTEWSRTAWKVEPSFAISKDHEFDVHNGYDQPAKLGVDRWVAMLAARSLTPTNCVVIDCGTAVTIDALNATGRHLGGVILPGVGLMHAALYRNTDITIQAPGEITTLGRNTPDCIWGGTVNAIGAAIDRISNHMAEEMEGECQRLITGGNVELLLPHLHGRYRQHPDLIFRGLRLIAGIDR